jgi:hypothetical protein
MNPTRFPTDLELRGALQLLSSMVGYLYSVPLLVKYCGTSCEVCDATKIVDRLQEEIKEEIKART